MVLIGFGETVTVYGSKGDLQLPRSDLDNFEKLMELGKNYTGAIGSIEQCSPWIPIMLITVPVKKNQSWLVASSPFTLRTVPSCNVSQLLEKILGFCCIFS